jgi:putative endonuclease
VNNVKKGHDGETKGAEYLVNNGYQIVERNFRTNIGEIDIIAKQDDFLVFVEVKTWNAYSFENIEYALNRKKIRRIMAVSKYFLLNYPEYTDSLIRYDLIFLSPDGVILKHLEGAFEGA